MFPHQPTTDVIEDYGLELARGNIPKTTYINKFGHAPDFDTTDGAVDLWDGANDASPNLMTYTFSSTADIDSLSSSNNVDTQNIEVQGLDTNWNLVTQTVALTGQTRVALTTSLIRVFRMKNMGATTLAGVCYCFVNVTTTGGVPDNLAKIRAMIEIGNNQTMMCLYTVPARTTGYLKEIFVSTAGATKSSAYEIKVLARPFGGVFQLKHEVSISDTATSNYQYEYHIPEVYPEKTDIKITGEALAGAVTATQLSGGFSLILIRE